VAAVLLAVSEASRLVCSPSPSPSGVIPHRVPLTQLERPATCAAHISEFSPVSNRWLAECGNVRPPELCSPDPLLHVQDDDVDVRVSFIVIDGHVHSAFVLDSGARRDQIVLRAVRFWRYRPHSAMCSTDPKRA